MPRMGERGRELSIIGEEQQSFRVVVEATDGINVFLDTVQQIDNGRPPLRIGSRRDIAAWLVQQDIARPLGGFDAASVDAEVVARRVGFGAQRANRITVDGYATVSDQPFCSAARRNSGLRQDLLKAQQAQKSKLKNHAEWER